eukprot:1187461-Prorocentrum_minimum.AAC.2
MLVCSRRECASEYSLQLVTPRAWTLRAVFRKFHTPPLLRAGTWYVFKGQKEHSIAPEEAKDPGWHCTQRSCPRKLLKVPGVHGAHSPVGCDESPLAM